MTEIKKDNLPTAELSMLNRIECDLVEIHALILEIKKNPSVAKMNCVTLIFSVIALIVAIMR